MPSRMSFHLSIERNLFELSNGLSRGSFELKVSWLVTHLTRLGRNVANVRFTLCRASATASVAC